MFDTEDLPSYISGYEQYLDEIEKANNYEEPYDYADEYYEEFILRKELENMRKIINPKNMNLTFEDLFYLEDYIWKGDKLIPAEMIEGE